MKRVSVLKLSLILALVAALGYGAYSQCAKMGKNKVSELAPYVFSGQINSMKLVEGQNANLTGALLGGQEYKIMVVGSEGFGPFIFRILDKDKKVLFDNKDHADAQSWTFKVGATEDYTIEVGVPEAKKKRPADQTAPSVCVALIVGFRPA